MIENEAVSLAVSIIGTIIIVYFMMGGRL